MKRTFLINDLVWIGFGAAVCYGGLKLGFGSFSQPHAGFMPFLAGLVLAFLALADLVFGVMKQWKTEKSDSEIWAHIHWGKLLLTVAVLFLYTVLFTTVGFLVTTIFLLFYLYRVMEPKTWKMVIFASLLTTLLFYVGFKFGLESQLPRGPWGF